ncbi:MAG: NAD(P)/FAD-dependent oxidoreductase [Acidimicrobiales bacterium]
MSTDVIVVGAGLAGLAAANHLSAAGLEVSILEASDGVGGRVRTDHVDGFRLDRGFQVHNTGYPEALRILDQDDLGLRPFVAGALIHYQGKRHRLVDPRRQPSGAIATAGSPLLTLNDKARIGLLAARSGYGSVDRMLRRKDTSTAEALRDAGIGPAGLEHFLRPFLSGVFLERELSTSARFFNLVWRTFVRGSVVVPERGMQAIPDQLAARFAPGVIRLGTRVAEIFEHGVVTTDGERLLAARVVVAAEADTAVRLLPGLGAPPKWQGVTTLYHAVPTPPLEEAILLLDADAPDLIANTVVLTATAPAYSDDSQALISTSVVGSRREDPRLEQLVQKRLGVLYDLSPTELDLVASYRIDRALPAMPAPLDVRKPVRVGPGRYVCGDWRDTSSIQGALVSGRRAATAVLRDMAAGR